MTDSERRALAVRLFGTGKKGEPPGPLDAGWAVAHLTGSRTTLMRWRERGIPPDRLDDVLEAVGLVLGITKEAPRPEWAEGLESRVADAVVMRLDESPGAALEAELVRLGLLPSEPRTEGSPERQAGARRAPPPPARQGGKG